MSKLHSLLGVLLLLFLNISFANAQLYVNEWMAANNNTLTDTTGEYDDWIEIYNSSSNPVDIAGYFLSDDVTDLVKWQIPNGSPATTTIPANGFLLLWADNDTDQGANHLAFKLGANGEPIVLTAPDGTTILDQVLYGPQSDDISYGRGMDGSATFQFFVNATPGISNNTLTGPLTYNAIFDIPVLEGSDDAEEPVNQSFTAISENILNIVNDWSGDQKVGIRFQNIPFPQGAIINKARIQFTSAFPTASVGPSNLTIEAELSANSSTFSNAANDVSNRPTGSESINWQPEEWTVLNAATEKERTPDLSVLVQEVVDQSNWSEDNAISFIFSGTGKRIPWAADNGNENVVPRLFIEGELPAPTSLMEGVVINEIAARGTSFEDEFGECDDWIELYNNTSTTAAIGGLFLTDDPDNLAKWQIASPVEIPAGGFQTLWIDKDTEQGGLHANFKLSGSGDQIILVQWIDNEFVILDQVDFGEVPFQASYGRTTDGGNTWKTFGEITPNATNENALGWLPSPTIDLQTGAYNGTQTVSISHPDPSVTIYYTTDGSEPSVNATLYTSPISISENTSLKAIAFANGVVESQPAQASYLIDEDLSIPALFINTDPDNFFDDNTGIYVEGTNGIPGFCVNDPVNWNQDWEVPVNLSMITEDGDLAFSVNAGAKIGGGCSRQYGLKSLNIYTRETKYGSEKINYPLFAGRDHDNYERIKLRNSGQDYLRTGFRDGLLHSLLWDKLDLELQGFQPSALFLNGEFWGVMNIRERYTDEFFEETLGFEKDEIDVIRNPGLDWEDIKQGNADDYQQLYDFIENSNFDNEANFAQAAAQIDINNFINYWATMTYAANADWPANNILTWKEKQSEGKWRYAVMDQDNSSNTGFNPQTDTDFNTLAQITDENSVNWPNHKNSTLFFRKLLENERFRAEYIQRTCSFIHLIYNEERTHHFIDSIQTMIDPYMDEHITKWAADNAGGGAYINWLGWVDEFRNFFSDRPALMRGFINDQFNLNGTYELLLNYDATTGGVVRINSNQMETPYNYAGLYFKGVPVEVTAVANPGYEFSHWLETGETESTINFVSNDDAILTPVFQTSFNIDIGSDTSICEGSTLQLDVSVPGCDCDYVWSDGTTESILEIIAGVQTTYTVTVTDDLGTTATDEITIAINSSPTVNANTTSVNCSGDSDGSINLTTTGAGVNYSYSWSTGSQSEDLTNIVAGTYDVTITGNNGCETVVENISVNEPDDFEIIIEEASTSCAGESDGIIDITVEGATPDYTFIWSNNATTEDQEDIPSGNYAVTITDAVGCTSAQFVELVEPTAIDANVIIDLPQPGSSDGSILLEPLGGTPPYTIEWVNGETENLLSDIAFGIYSAVITDANGCTYQEIINFFPVNWTEPKDLLKFEIMPNPAIDFCTVEIALAVAKEFNLQLKNTTGQIIQQYTYKNTNESIDLDISNMESGIYILELKTTDGMAYRKLIIQ